MGVAETGLDTGRGGAKSMLDLKSHNTTPMWGGGGGGKGTAPA